MNRNKYYDLTTSGCGIKRQVFTGVLITLVLVTGTWGQIKGQRIIRGKVNFAQNGDLTTIQANHKSIINYDQFSILGHQTVQFIQPDSRAKVLNRVSGTIPSYIDG